MHQQPPPNQWPQQQHQPPQQQHQPQQPQLAQPPPAQRPKRGLRKLEATAEKELHKLEAVTEIQRVAPAAAHAWTERELPKLQPDKRFKVRAANRRPCFFL